MINKTYFSISGFAKSKSWPGSNNSSSPFPLRWHFPKWFLSHPWRNNLRQYGLQLCHSSVCGHAIEPPSLHHTSWEVWRYDPPLLSSQRRPCEVWTVVFYISAGMACLLQIAQEHLQNSWSVFGALKEKTQIYLDSAEGLRNRRAQASYHLSIIFITNSFIACSDYIKKIFFETDWNTYKTIENKIRNIPHTSQVYMPFTYEYFYIHGM